MPGSSNTTGCDITSNIGTTKAAIKTDPKATITPDRTISGSYDWLRLGQGATDRQCLLRSPAAVAYRDRSPRVVALSRTIGEYRWQEPSYEIVRLVVAINRGTRRPMVRSIVGCNNRSHDQS